MPPLPPAALLSADPSDRDVRRRRPALLSLLLRWETLRRLARVASLLVLDFAGVFLAIYTALAIKALVRGKFGFDLTLRETKDTVAFAYLLTALLFARSSLYADRGERPGLTRIVASLFQVAFVALLFAVVNGVLAAPLMAIMMTIAMNKRIMGRLTLSRPMFVMGWLATFVMALATVAFFAL